MTALLGAFFAVVFMLLALWIGWWMLPVLVFTLVAIPILDAV